MQKSLLAITLVCSTLALTACSNLRFPGVYRIDVSQGNVLTADMIDKLKVGMTPAQVQYVMGSPMIADPFHANRWDYLYRMETGSGDLTENRLTLLFDDGRLAEINDSQLDRSLLTPDQTLLTPASAADADLPLTD